MNKERLNPHFNINAKYEAMIRDSKEIVKHYLSKESNGEPNEGVCLAYDVKNYLPSLLEENNQLKERITYLERSCERKEETIINERDENIELSNKIDKAVELIEDSYYSKNTTDIDSIGLTTNKLIQIRKILKDSDVDE